VTTGEGDEAVQAAGAEESVFADEGAVPGESAAAAAVEAGADVADPLAADPLAADPDEADPDEADPDEADPDDADPGALPEPPDEAPTHE
jgi:hypothetical protein